MKIGNYLLAVVLSAGFMAGQAFAFTCPVLQKEANESIAKAESAAANISGEREKGRPCR